MSNRSKGGKSTGRLCALQMYDMENLQSAYIHLERQHASERTTAWMECHMIELRERAKRYEKMIGGILIDSRVEFIHQAPFLFPDKKIHFATFFIPSLKLDIEIESGWRQTIVEISRQMERDRRFELNRIKVVRIPTDESSDKIAISEIIEDVLH